jgi:hypothetical protein
MDEETLAMERMAAIAAHHGWTENDCLWRLFNALIVGEGMEVATLLWGIDNVASLETEMSNVPFRPMLDPTLPSDRPHDELYQLGARREARRKALD